MISKAYNITLGDKAIGSSVMFGVWVRKYLIWNRVVVGILLLGLGRVAVRLKGGGENETGEFLLPYHMGSPNYNSKKNLNNIVFKNITIKKFELIKGKQIMKQKIITNQLLNSNLIPKNISQKIFQNKFSNIPAPTKGEK